MNEDDTTPSDDASSHDEADNPRPHELIEPEEFAQVDELGEASETVAAHHAHAHGHGHGHGPHAAKGGMAGLMLGAVGIVFGDIGTSPMYALKETFNGHHQLDISQSSVYGVISLVFWSIMVIVSLKYVLFIMRMDNDGEGGIMALISLIRKVGLNGERARNVLIALGIFGAALFYGDGMITPAISVLSAVEGLQIVAPSLDSFVIPIAVVILIGLFSIQRFGTAVVGRVFGPVMLLWFGTMATLGLIEVFREPAILHALSPVYGVRFFLDNGSEAFLALGSVVLAVTGAEALYADMGHFGRAPIQRSWFFFVLPALLCNYLGQGALMLTEPDAVDSPFFRLAPDALQLPLVLLATFAAVIASQAVISGAFSVTRQAVQLGFLPRLRVLHTSRESIGQIYVPAVNWMLLVAILALVIGFGSSSALASAYGIAVTGTLAIDTILACVVVRLLWRKPLWMAIGAAVFFLIVDLAFFTANTTKIPSGGWFPLAIGVGLFLVLTTWWRGRERVTEIRQAEEGSLPDFVVELDASDDPPHRVPGTAIFLNASSDNVPLAMRYNVTHNRVLHERVLVVHVLTASVPFVEDTDRLRVDTVLVPDDGIDLVEVTFGYQEDPDVPRALALLPGYGMHDVDLDGAIYFLSRVLHVPTKGLEMPRWRKTLFASIALHATSPDLYFCLPEERVVAFGSNIEF